ncbi:MAG: exodeoxyribonuclease III [Gammaproteobacteria bacterium]|nr:exodeoxyribonuclease III [Gammaproteobacteria bacterium]MCH9763169.1 exodeoxyribonuclease III [Gammaproteobacteria bacterium]
MIKIASWNVNSITVRLEAVLAWLETSKADVLALQETKVPDERFPKEAFLERGYHVAFSGQKTYNGVAVISRMPIQDIVTDISGYDDVQRRFLAVTVSGVRVVNLYVPNGSAVGTDKYAYKLEWLAHVTALIKKEQAVYPKLVVLGDFNIAPDDRDVHDPARWAGSVLVSPPERAAYQALVATGLTDSFRLFDQENNAFSWWDYRAAGFPRNHGLRIDLVLLSDALKLGCVESQIDVAPRRAERPSDHAPVWVVCN